MGFCAAGASVYWELNSAPSGVAGKVGTRVVVPYRDEDEARHFKPMGDLGQIIRMVRVVCLWYGRGSKINNSFCVRVGMGYAG